MASADNEALKYLWARKRIQLLDDFAQFGRSEDLKNEVTELGLKYNLLTQYTSFVAIDSEIRNQDGKQTTVVQPLPLPEGVSDKAIGNGYIGSGAVKQKKAEYAVAAEFSRVAAEREMQSRRVEEVMEVAEAEVSLEDIALDEPEHPEVYPAFIGGQEALDKYVRQNLHLTEADLKKWKGQKLKVKFVVKADGTITDIKITGTQYKLLRSRVLKMMLGMPKWKPGELNGHKTAAEMTLPIKI